ncbi:MAG TPA: hypothetical protein VK404_01375 [Spirosoma sp.]|nr:hypothetical protein [Spirosoma sp.]
MTYSDFETRWKLAGGAERANYGLFLQDLCDLIGVERPDPTTPITPPRMLTSSNGPSTFRMGLWAPKNRPAYRGPAGPR